MFANPCLGELEYEATTSAIVLAGLFLSFLVDYAGQRVVSFRASGMTRNPNGNDLEHTEPKGAAPGSTPRSDSPTSGANGPGRSRAILAYSDDKLSVLTMEAGIIFHSASE